MSLSQHAIVLPYNAEEGLEPEQIQIGNQNFNRSVQQYQSTPIQNFRTLRSREISVDHSQNANNEEQIAQQQRLRSDSMETDKGNPLQNQAPVTDQEDLIQLNQEIHQQTYGSPPSQTSQMHQMNLTKSNFENLNHLIGEVIVVNPIYHLQEEEEDKEAHQQLKTRANAGSFGAVPLYSSGHQEEEKAAALVDITFAAPETPVDLDNQLTASKRNIHGGGSLFTNINIAGEDDGGIYHQPRRSKRLESRHNQLMTSMSQGGDGVSAGGFHQDDELNGAYSQDGSH